MEILSENIRYYRKAKKLTQLQLAEALFVSPQTVSKWEGGISQPDTENLCAMADIFEISLDNLIRIPVSKGKKAYIAIDGGGTKTAFILFLENGEILEMLTLGGTNPNAYGIEAAEKTLAEGIDRLISIGAQVKGLYAGISGASVGDNKEILKNYLSSRYPFISICLEGDIMNVVNSAGSVDKCVGVISGTGSVVYGFDGNDLYRAGGWGYLFDEAGSGFDIGRDLFKYCLACEDDTAPMGKMYDAVRSQFERSVFDSLSIIYSKGKDYIASFSRTVFDFYRMEDSVAIGIVKKTVDRLAELILQVREKCDCGNKIVISGGLMAERDIIEPLLRKRLGDKIEIIIPQMPPIYGAAIRCAKKFGFKIDLKRLEISFAEASKQ